MYQGRIDEVGEIGNVLKKIDLILENENKAINIRKDCGKGYRTHESKIRKVIWSLIVECLKNKSISFSLIM